MITCYYTEYCYIIENYKAYYIKCTLHSEKIMCATMHIPSHAVENWDVFSYIALFPYSIHLTQGHIGILTLEI